MLAGLTKTWLARHSHHSDYSRLYPQRKPRLAYQIFVIHSIAHSRALSNPMTPSQRHFLPQ